MCLIVCDQKQDETSASFSVAPQDRNGYRLIASMGERLSDELERA